MLTNRHIKKNGKNQYALLKWCGDIKKSLINSIVPTNVLWTPAYCRIDPSSIPSCFSGVIPQGAKFSGKTGKKGFPVEISIRIKYTPSSTYAKMFLGCNSLICSFLNNLAYIIYIAVKVNAKSPRLLKTADMEKNNKESL